ncbi:MAG: Long-chain-fatty-acid--CoA ligase [Acidimicrobiaceae bacterium]|nr:Long-chain-fatty-acid--CoA ligase [Acidimicrobiaceae bacterium]
MSEDPPTKEEANLSTVARATDVIIRGEDQVYSAVVEGAILEHPDVADCAVIGLAHPILGEEVAAVVVLRPGRVIEAEEISRHVATRLDAFQVPTRVIFSSRVLPRSPLGKVLKRELRNAVLDRLSAQA